MFEWDDDNLHEIAAHGLRPGECEEAMTDPRRVPRRASSERGEWRGGIIGVTRAGRLLVVIYTIRGARFRTVTAWPAGARDARAYREREQ